MNRAEGNIRFLSNAATEGLNGEVFNVRAKIASHTIEAPSILFSGLQDTPNIRFACWGYDLADPETFKRDFNVMGDGKVGIGTEAPTARTHIVPDKAGDVGLKVDGATGQTANLLELGGTTEKVSVDKTGTLEIGTASTGAATFSTNGLKVWSNGIVEGSRSGWGRFRFHSSNATANMEGVFNFEGVANAAT